MSDTPNEAYQKFIAKWEESDEEEYVTDRTLWVRVRESDDVKPIEVLEADEIFVNVCRTCGGTGVVPEPASPPRAWNEDMICPDCDGIEGQHEWRPNP